jgi:hypothetical protein
LLWLSFTAEGPETATNAAAHNHAVSVRVDHDYKVCVRKLSVGEIDSWRGSREVLVFETLYILRAKLEQFGEICNFLFLF